MTRTEEDVQRVRMALAESGHAPSVWLTSGGRIAFNWGGATPSNPKYVTWKACAVAGCVTVCWPCRRPHPRWPPEPLGPCGHLVDPFCPEDCEAVA